MLIENSPTAIIFNHTKELILLAIPTGKQPRGSPRTSCCD